jgi:penicillin-binding protein 1A
VAADVIIKTGGKNVISTTRDVGVEADLPQVPSLALGVASISLKELLFAYATLSNGGIRTAPYYLKSITDGDGNLLAQFNRPDTNKAKIQETNCRLIIRMMETAANEGTGSRIRSTYRIQGSFAAKTGTTQNHSDGWFVGITPHLVTGSWVGAEDPGIHFRSITYGQGAAMALPIVGKFFHKLYGNPKYRHLQHARFSELPEEILADLNIPPFKEILEIERPENILDRLFAGKNREEKLKEIQRPEPPEEETKGVWKAIRGIFKKKN